MRVLAAAMWIIALMLPAAIQTPTWFIWAVSVGSGQVTVATTNSSDPAPYCWLRELAPGLTISADSYNYFAINSQVLVGRASAFYGVDSGTAQAQEVSIPSSKPTSLSSGLFVAWSPIMSNTAAGPTLAVNGLAAKPIIKGGTAPLAIGDIATSAVAYALYDGTEFQLLSPQTIINAASKPLLCCDACRLLFERACVNHNSWLGHAWSILTL